MDYFRVEDEIYTFCENDVAPEVSKLQLEELKNKLEKLLELERISTDNYTYKLKILDYHAQRHKEKESFKNFKKQEHPAPIIRIGILPISFHKDDYIFMKQFSENTKIPIQELADLNWSNKYATDQAINIYTNQIQWLTFHFERYKFCQVPSIVNLNELNSLTLTGGPVEKEDVVDFNTISSFDKHIDRLIINDPGGKKLILTGSFGTCEFFGIENLEKLDCTGMDLRNCHSIRAQYCKNNKPCIITEAQKNYPNLFGKFKWEKEIKPSTKEEIETYSALYNWDNGLKFLLWAVKHPACDRGSALGIYWHGSPAYFTKYAKATEVEKHQKDNYSLLKRIEKRIKKNDFKTNDFKFSIDSFLEQHPLNYPEDKQVDIPSYMFEK